jgi:hypothetical protein
MIHLVAWFGYPLARYQGRERQDRDLRRDEDRETPAVATAAIGGQFA